MLLVFGSSARDPAYGLAVLASGLYSDYCHRFPKSVMAVYFTACLL